jgi:hypothetical protein
MPLTKKNDYQQRNGRPARRKTANRFMGATQEEINQKVEEYNRHLDTLSEQEVERQLALLSLDEAHLLAWTTTYNQHNKRRRKKGLKK